MNYMRTFKKLGRYEFTVDGLPLVYRKEFEKNPFLGAFKVLAHASDVETALSFYAAFQKILDRLPDGAKFTNGEIEEWVQWKTVGPELNEAIPQTDRPLSLREIPNLVFRLPEFA